MNFVVSVELSLSISHVVLLRGVYCCAIDTVHSLSLVESF